MKLIDLNLSDFNNEVDSSSPAPGGGSVSSLASSLGVSLVRMVGHITANKKKFQKLDIDIQNEFNSIEDSLIPIKNELIELIDKDTDAFNLIMKAFKLPKETDEEKSFRKQKILEGTIEAIKVPHRVSELSLEALKKMDFILQYGNKNAISDIGVGALLLHAGLEGAILNVKINLPGLTDPAMISHYQDSISTMLEESKVIKENILTKIHISL